VRVGKRILDDLYVHLSAVDSLSEQHRKRIERALDACPATADNRPNVAKLNLRSGQLSLLLYRDFETVAFPELDASWVFAPEDLRSSKFRTYRDSLNPPVLHRKELLVGEDHPQRASWSELTKTAESLGLFDDTSSIGFRLNWDRRIAEKGFRFDGLGFVPLANREDLSESHERQTLEWGTEVRRYLTALSRTTISAPLQLLVRHALLSGSTTFFDYGCGRGDDIASLRSQGITADGWDPHYRPDEPRREADVVNLGFVVNVIEDPAERVDALTGAFALARGVLAIGVMLHANDVPGRPYRDGFLTSRSTFQKYFQQSEFKEWIEHVLNREAFLVGPGVAFVFKDDRLEQQFLDSRYRSRSVSQRLLSAGAREASRRAREALITERLEQSRQRQLALEAKRQERIAARLLTEAERTQRAEARRRLALERLEERRAFWLTRAAEKQEAEEAIRRVLDGVWAVALSLGRFPEGEEEACEIDLDGVRGGLKGVIRKLSETYPMELLAEARAARIDDLRVLFAIRQFERKAPYKRLEPRLQRDVRAFFGDYRTALASGLHLLRLAADTGELGRASEEASSRGLGWLEPGHSFQLHISLMERLPAVLRAYVWCGLVLWDDTAGVDLIKIHIGSGKLTLLQCEDFESSPLPTLKRRIKVNLRKLDYQVFEYGTREHPAQPIYLKSRYLSEEFPGYEGQVRFDEALAATGVLDNSAYGPSREEANAFLALRRLEVVNWDLRASQTIPGLDEPCGGRFTYRQLIECGETQRRLSIPNRPVQSATYNALYSLATKILDPVCEYFGPIELTYGFCSSHLAKQIKARIAPELDQHAACELNRRGALICARGGAACDFLVRDEDMEDVARWIIENLPFDRLYFYGRDRPIHVSYSESATRAAYRLVETVTGHRVPRPFVLCP
jgi:hypothetical protein